MPYNCLESINSIYVEKKADGYVTKPCCLFKQRGPNVEDINELLDNDYINEIREGFKGDWKRPECEECIIKESVGKKTSKRQQSLARGDKGILVWDLRPGNTCNLKCAMCNPFNSSKWYEDLDVYSKYLWPGMNKQLKRVRESLDWDWVYERCKDKAEKIYIAGGEPFYMKSVHNFLDKLSKHKWNCDYTIIEIQTNGVSNTVAFLKILKKFKRLRFIISIDGWGSVNELIRYPTQHDIFCQSTQQLVDLNPKSSSFNITVQAMNLPNVDKVVTKLRKKWSGCTTDIHKLYHPNFLSVNCLKPHVVQRVLKYTRVQGLKEFYKDYKFDEEGNATMIKYLLDLDSKRGTNSKKTIPWCFE